MNAETITFAGETLELLGSGALYWPRENLLVISDLHLGKSERIARVGGALLPPYETRDTLARIATDLHRTGARTVVSLGDSFDDLDAARGLDDADRMTLSRLQAGRQWVWVEGNHDPGAPGLGGSFRGEVSTGPLVFRHIARPGATAEISGHYHPKATLSVKGRHISRPCFMFDEARLIMPAYGTYTGGLRWHEPALRGLFAETAFAALLGDRVRVIPVPALAPRTRSSA